MFRTTRRKTATLRARDAGALHHRSIADISPHFGRQENFAESCGNGYAAYYLWKARMAFIEAYAKLVRQADMREYFQTRKREGGRGTEEW